MVQGSVACVCGDILCYLLVCSIHTLLTLTVLNLVLLVLYFAFCQEIVELTPVNVAVDPQGAARTQFWLNNIATCLMQHTTGTEDTFLLVGVKHLVGVMMCIYAKASLCSAIQDVRWATNAVGVMGVMGNKGGVTCR